MAEKSQATLFNVEDITIECPLKDRRVGFIGTFKNRAALIRKVKEFGAKETSKDGLTQDTQILVVGTDVKQETLNRLSRYIHDGWLPLQITEQDLQNIFAGQYQGFETPKDVQKRLNINFSYYNWMPPVEDEVDEDCGVRCSSPLVYGESNAIYGMEMYVPDIPNVNMKLFRQIIGNLGGFANAEYYDETNVILLSNETLNKLKNGEKDSTILQIEERYNKSSSKAFNVQFTCESEFIIWAKQRVEKINDTITKELINAYLASKNNN